jgi:hypothetical protein
MTYYAYMALLGFFRYNALSQARPHGYAYQDYIFTSRPRLKVDLSPIILSYASTAACIGKPTIFELQIIISPISFLQASSCCWFRLCPNLKRAQTDRALSVRHTLFVHRENTKLTLNKTILWFLTITSRAL